MFALIGRMKFTKFGTKSEQASLDTNRTQGMQHKQYSIDHGKFLTVFNATSVLYRVIDFEANRT